MALTRKKSARGFKFVDTRPEIPKKQIFIFGSIVASCASILAGAYVMYIQYLNNPTFHMFIQDKGIYL